MSDKPKGTGWIQNLRKEQIIEELEKRGENFENSDNYDKLREQLRKLLKKEQKEADSKPTEEEVGKEESTVEKEIGNQ